LANLLKFVCGRAGSGKTNYIFDEIAANVAVGRKSYLLVPDQFSMFCEKRLIDMLGLSSQKYAVVLSFSRLTNRVLSESGPLRINYIDAAAKAMLIKRALDKSIDKLTILRRAARLTGFSEIMQNIISEFKRYNVTLDKLFAARNETSNDDLSAKLGDIAIIFEEYEILLAAGYDDMEDNLSLCAARLSKCDFLSGATVYIDNFKSFSALEYDVLREIMKSADVFMSLTMDAARVNTVFASANHTYRRLIDIANEEGIEVASDTALSGSAKFDDNPELAHLERNFFNHNSETYAQTTENITLFYPQNHYNEIDEACRQINCLVAKYNYHYRDICVLYREIENYEGVIPALFAKHKIPYFCDQNRSIMNNPLIRHALSVMEILAFGFSYERVSTTMKSGFCAAESRQIDLLENYILAADISYRLWREDTDWKAVADIPEEFMDDINTARRAVLSPIMRLKSSIKGRKSAKEISGAYLAYFKEIEMVEKLQSKMQTFTATGQHGKIDEYTGAWKALNSVIVQISQIFGDEQMTYETYLSLLTSGLAGLKVGVTPPTQDEVLVSQIDRFRNHGAKVVLVLGLNDGVLPKSHNAEGILSDRERDELNELGVQLAETQEFRQTEEQNLIYNVITAPSERLLLSSPLASRDGKPLIESFICGRLKHIFPSVNVIVPRDVTAKTEISSPIAQPPLKISKSMARKLYGEHLWLSISKVEKYNGCAFSYFLQYGLFAKPRATAEFRQNARGALLHDVLARYFENVKQNTVPYETIDRNACEREIRAITKSAVSENYSVMMDLSPSFGYFARRIENVAATTAWNIVKFYKQSKFRPFGFEISFRPDGKGDFESPKVSVSGEIVGSLVGDIDRVDIADIYGKDYITIVDYKSSGKKLDAALVDEGVQIQPLAYANMMSQSIDAKAGAMLYMSMDEPLVKVSSPTDEKLIEKSVTQDLKMSGWILNNEDVKLALDVNTDEKGRSEFIPTAKSALYDDLSAELDKANKAIQRAAEGMIDGNIAIKARNIKGHDPCRWCEYGSICAYGGL